MERPERYESPGERPDPSPRPPLAWKCSSDGIHYAAFTKKRCKFCLPMYEQKELDSFGIVHDNEVK